MASKRILISGGAGFIGSHLAEAFLKKGYAVTIVDNLLTGREENISRLIEQQSVKFYRVSVENFSPANEESYEFILHFASAASPKDYMRYPIETLKVESLGTFRLLDLAKEMGSRFVLASTSEVYGDPQVHPQPESYWGYVNPVGPRSVYDEAKRFAEASTMAYKRKYDLDVRILRIFNTYGPKMRVDDGRVVPNFIVNALRGDPLPVYGDGSQTRSFCYIDDTVRAIVQLTEKDGISGTVVNIGNPKEISIMELKDTLGRVLGRDLQVKFFPLPQDDPKRRQPDISLIGRLVGWKPEVSLEEGLKKTVEWFKKKVGLFEKGKAGDID